MSVKQIRFFKKNIIDLSNDLCTVTVTDALAYSSGDDIVDYIRNRRNDSAWLTTDSDDVNNTTIEVQFGVSRDVTDILLVKHNWKAFTIKYWNGSAWTAFSTPIAQTVNTDETSHFTFTSVDTTAIQIIITGTQVANADKQLYQLIVTEQIGLLEGWPIIKNPEHDRNKKISKMLSGKANVQDSIGGFSCELTVTHWKIAADLAIVETLYSSREGFLIWLCGGIEAQFSMNLMGYRLEDLFLVRPTNSYEPEFVKGQYGSGVTIKVQLAESIE